MPQLRYYFSEHLGDELLLQHLNYKYLLGYFVVQQLARKRTKEQQSPKDSPKFPFSVKLQDKQKHLCSGSEGNLFFLLIIIKNVYKMISNI